MSETQSPAGFAAQLGTTPRLHCAPADLHVLGVETAGADARLMHRECTKCISSAKAFPEISLLQKHTKSSPATRKVLLGHPR
jgi:hypothetical protein